MNQKIAQIRRLLNRCTFEQRREIFEYLRKEFRIHPIEADLNTQAEIILEAISRDRSGLTFRMMRGVIAEAAFEIEVVKKLSGWIDTTPAGDLPYDFRLEDPYGPVRVQVKLQRSKQFKPVYACQARKQWSPDMYVVEMWKTRKGVDLATGEPTRFYKLGEFDILAVSMQPSTNDWSTYMYTNVGCSPAWKKPIDY